MFTRVITFLVDLVDLVDLKSLSGFLRFLAYALFFAVITLALCNCGAEPHQTVRTGMVQPASAVGTEVVGTYALNYGAAPAGCAELSSDVFTVSEPTFDAYAVVDESAAYETPADVTLRGGILKWVITDNDSDDSCSEVVTRAFTFNVDGRNGVLVVTGSSACSNIQAVNCSYNFTTTSVSR